MSSVSKAQRVGQAIKVATRGSLGQMDVEDTLAFALKYVSVTPEQKDDEKHITELVQKKLKQCNLPINGPISVFGSTARNTSLKNSDLDFIVPLENNFRQEGGETMSASDLLSNFADYLVTHFAIEEDRHRGTHKQTRSVAVTVKGHFVDLVPAFACDSDVETGYKIPDRDSDSRWIVTDPARHYLALGRLNKKTSGRLIPVIRLLKAWNKNQQSPLICSFEIEQLLCLMDPNEMKDRSLRKSLKIAFGHMAKNVRMLELPARCIGSFALSCGEAVEVLRGESTEAVGMLFGVPICEITQAHIKSMGKSARSKSDNPYYTAFCQIGRGSASFAAATIRQSK